MVNSRTEAGNTQDESGTGTPLVVQWLRLHTSNAEDAGSIPGQGTKIPHATQWGQKKKPKETISKVKRQPSEWEKIIANEATDEELISKIYEQLM